MTLGRSYTRLVTPRLKPRTRKSRKLNLQRRSRKNRKQRQQRKKQLRRKNQKQRQQRKKQLRRRKQKQMMKKRPRKRRKRKKSPRHHYRLNLIIQVTENNCHTDALHLATNLRFFSTKIFWNLTQRLPIRTKSSSAKPLMAPYLYLTRGFLMGSSNLRW
ncbi:SH3 domain-binding glutamic acid-rich protein isoform X2 [Hyla sarda]|uniref:SH3 domain-binding glutamic acid-rich protein isoform X2 n=1 Tax=Hyla sarda TaxID=327740 RepID=UPI0024C3958D|nr:SH3 domain-binding glutamic acid-rich protein isoform X2 [Hyla sarda]